MKWQLLLGLGLVPFLAGADGGHGEPALPGTLAYVQNNAVYVQKAAGGPARRIPQSTGGWVALSPAGTAVFYVSTDKNGTSRGFVSRPPYTRVEALPAPLNRTTYPGLIWSPDGGTAFVTTFTGSEGETRGRTYSYTPATGRVRSEPFPVDTASRNGRVTAWAPDQAIALHEAGQKEATTVFTRAEPKPVLAALRSARHPGNLKYLFQALKESGKEKSEEEVFGWQVSTPALAPDGQALYFASNLGASMGASAMTTYCFFVVDVAKKKLTALSGLGEIDGLRMPETCSVSPDGRKLLFVAIEHGSAIQNTRNLFIVDLLTQRSQELLTRGYTDDDSNFMAGTPCWSPDGRYVATDVLSYRINRSDYSIRLRKPQGRRGKAQEPTDNDYDVLIFDAATGRQVRRIPHAKEPSWSR